MKTDSVAVQMEQLLNEYNEELHQAIEDAGKSTAKAVANQLKSTSPRDPKGKNSGRYASGWAVKKDYDGYIVYNKTDWQLTHLLANGHAVANRYGDTGARTEGNSHIADAEQFGIAEYPIRISRGLK